MGLCPLLSHHAATRKVTEILVRLHDRLTVVEELTITHNTDGTEELHMRVRGAALGGLNDSFRRTDDVATASALLTPDPGATAGSQDPGMADVRGLPGTRRKHLYEDEATLYYPLSRADRK